MKKGALLLAAVFAVCFAAPAFAQNHGANSHENEMTPTRMFNGICKGAKYVFDGVCEGVRKGAECVVDGVKWVGQEMSECMEGFGQGGYYGPHDPTANQQKKDEQAKKAGQGATKAGVTGAKAGANAGKKNKAPSESEIANAAQRKAAEQKRKNLSESYFNSTERAADNFVETMLGHK